MVPTKTQAAKVATSIKKKRKKRRPVGQRKAKKRNIHNPDQKRPWTAHYTYTRAKANAVSSLAVSSLAASSTEGEKTKVECETPLFDSKIFHTARDMLKDSVRVSQGKRKLAVDSCSSSGLDTLEKQRILSQFVGTKNVTRENLSKGLEHNISNNLYAKANRHTKEYGAGVAAPHACQNKGGNAKALYSSPLFREACKKIQSEHPKISYAEKVRTATKIYTI